MASSKKVMAIRLNAGNDSNGNPRRVYVVFDSTGKIIDAIDEGYSGIQALDEVYPKHNDSVASFDTSPSEYRELVKSYSKRSTVKSRSRTRR
jgi:hypothetical protein